VPTPRATINQQVQLGVETTPGTPVAASKLLVAFMWSLGLKPSTKQFRGTGRQYPSASSLLTEYSQGKISGPGDFAQCIYPLASTWGTPTFTLHGSSTTAYDAKWTPPLVGSYAANGKTFTVQMGDSSDAEQYAYLAFTGWGYSFDRKQEVQFSGDCLSQTFTEGVSLTASPTEVEQVPMTGAQFNVYLDTTSAGIGATQLTDPLKVDFKASGYFDPYFPINRANASYTSLVDKEKKHELKIMLQANSTGIAIKGNYLETGTRAYVRVAGVGPVIDAVHTVSAGMTHDMAVFVSDMAEFSDQDGVYAVEYTLQVGEDSAWSTGTAQIMTLTSLLAAL
jgi:hypothetical protein